MFKSGTPASDIPLKWMAQHAVRDGLIVRPRAFATVQRQVTTAAATGPIHTNGRAWLLLGRRTRTDPPRALVHASVRTRVEADPRYARGRLPHATYVDERWLTGVQPAAERPQPPESGC